MDPRSYQSAYVDATTLKEAMTQSGKPSLVDTLKRNKETKTASQSKSLVYSRKSIPTVGVRAKPKRGKQKVPAWYPSRDVRESRAADRELEARVDARMQASQPGHSGNGAQAVYSEHKQLYGDFWESKVNLPGPSGLPPGANPISGALYMDGAGSMSLSGRQG